MLVFTIAADSAAAIAEDCGSKKDNVEISRCMSTNAAAAWAETADAENLKLLNPEWLFYSVKEFRDWLSDHI